jgi:hypothetical protein
MQDEAGASWLAAACFLTVVKVNTSQAMNFVTGITATGSKKQVHVIFFLRSCDRASLMHSFKYNQQDATLCNIL